MTEVDIYIELFKRLKFKQIDEIQTAHSNILIYEGMVMSKSGESTFCCIKIWFNYKTEVVSSILCESRYIDDIDIFYTRPNFDSIYKDLIRDIKLKEYINEQIKSS